MTRWSGVIGEQSPTSLTFRQGPGVTTTVKRSDIKAMTVVPQSIMPETFADQITPEDMAHLLAYLTSSAYAQPPLPDAKTATPQTIATALLDDTQDQKARETLAREVATRATAVVQALVVGLPDNDEAEEYRRIPWIWRVAVAAGRAKDERCAEAADGRLDAEGRRSPPRLAGRRARRRRGDGPVTGRCVAA